MRHINIAFRKLNINMAFLLQISRIASALVLITCPYSTRGESGFRQAGYQSGIAVGLRPCMFTGKPYNFKYAARFHCYAIPLESMSKPLYIPFYLSML